MPILAFMCFFYQKPIMGNTWAPARATIFPDWKKSRPHRGQANFNFYDLFDQKRIVGTTWAPARAAIFSRQEKIPTAPGPGQFQLL